ncbi:MAG TPA: BON domain-containing protein [Abditibacteriaceae bacterium]|jgi:osmotically-inducible protein OsmY
MKKQETVWMKFAGVGALALVCAVGCQDKNNNGQPDSPATGQQVENAVEGAGDAVANAAGDAKDAGKNLDDAAVITPKVKTALANNASLAGSNINVDTTDKSVTLSGTVKNAAQKSVAGNIAKQNAPGYSIANSLKVAGGASPTMKKNP